MKKNCNENITFVQHKLISNTREKMNSMQYIKTTMITITQCFTTELDPKSLAKKMYASFDGKFKIDAVAFKDNEEIRVIGDVDGHPSIKLFPKTISFLCRTNNGKRFKIRVFTGKIKKTAQISSSLSLETSRDFLEIFTNSVKNIDVSCKIEIPNIVLINAIAECALGINFVNFMEQCEARGEKFLYTPETHSAIKLFLESGTIVIFRSGKILMMGFKKIEEIFDSINYVNNNFQLSPSVFLSN